MTTNELRSRLGRVGIWMPPPERIAVDPAATAAAIERAGFTSVWWAAATRTRRRSHACGRSWRPASG